MRRIRACVPVEAAPPAAAGGLPAISAAKRRIQLSMVASGLRPCATSAATALARARARFVARVSPSGRDNSPRAEILARRLAESCIACTKRGQVCFYATAVPGLRRSNESQRRSALRKGAGLTRLAGGKRSQPCTAFTWMRSATSRATRPRPPGIMRSSRTGTARARNSPER